MILWYQFWKLQVQKVHNKHLIPKTLKFAGSVVIEGLMLQIAEGSEAWIDSCHHRRKGAKCFLIKCSLWPYRSITFTITWDLWWCYRTGLGTTAPHQRRLAPRWSTDHTRCSLSQSIFFLIFMENSPSLRGSSHLVRGSSPLVRGNLCHTLWYKWI